jgi:lambda repressor-like predicted transcriptional regulator
VIPQPKGKVKVKLDALEKLQNGMSDAAFSRKIGVAQSTLFRIKLPDNDKRHCDPGKTFIANILNSHPDLKFEDVFFLASNFRSRNKYDLSRKNPDPCQGKQAVN